MLLLALFVATRLLLVVGSKPWQEDRRYTHFVVDDARYYYWAAANVVDGRGYSAKRQPPHTPSARKTPLYPFFLAGIMLLAGRSIAAIVVTQVIVQLLALTLIYLGVRKFFSTTTASWLLLYCILDPVFWIMGARLYSETLYVLLNVVVVYFMLDGMRREFSYRRAACLGIVFGLSLLTRDIGLYFPPLIVLAIVLSERRLAAAVKKAAVSLACMFLVVLPWLLRNESTFGRFSLSYLDGIVLIKGYAAPFLAETRSLSVDETRAALVAEAAEFEDPFVRSDYLWRRGWQIALSEPLRYLVFHFGSPWAMLLGGNTKGIPHLFDWKRHEHYVPAASADVGPEIDVDAGSEEADSVGAATRSGDGAVPGEPRSDLRVQAILMMNVVMIGALYLGFFYGMVKLWNEGGRRLLVVVVASILYFVVITGPNSASRYRLSFLPFLLYGAGIALESSAGRGDGWSRRPESTAAQNAGKIGNVQVGER